MTFYTQSVKPTRTWNGDKLGFLTADVNTFINNFFENKNLACLVSYDSNMDAQHLYMPALFDRVTQTDEVEKGTTVVGNGHDDMALLVPMKTGLAILHHVAVIMPKSEVHPTLSDRPALCKTYLKGSKWENSEVEMIAFPITASAPIQHGIEAPQGNLSDPEYHRVCKELGGEYEYHAEAMLKAHTDAANIAKVIDKLRKAN